MFCKRESDPLIPGLICMPCDELNDRSKSCVCGHESSPLLVLLGADIGLLVALYPSTSPVAMDTGWMKRKKGKDIANEEEEDREGEEEVKEEDEKEKGEEEERRPGAAGGEQLAGTRSEHKVQESGTSRLGGGRWN
mmetsp:Transcript_19293/g.63848  ORF Transcript_19293/g.63848 Transcript_19293/m.63848 type:complete len:136 (-) Transcript_19293:245-652(-)